MKEWKRWTSLILSKPAAQTSIKTSIKLSPPRKKKMLAKSKRNYVNFYCLAGSFLSREKLAGPVLI